MENGELRMENYRSELTKPIRLGWPSAIAGKGFE